MSYSSNASQRALNYITDNIRTGHWAAGSKIETEDTISEKLGVSRIAVRQAIEKLSTLAVLTKVQGSGTYVNSFEECALGGMVYYPPTLRSLRTVLEFRRMFDSCNAELFIQNATQQQKEDLYQNFRDMVQAKDDRERFEVYDNTFHEMIARGTNNTLICQLSDTLTELLIHHQALQYDLVGPEQAIKWHGRIVEAVQDGDGELARLYTRVHIDNAIKRLASADSETEEKP